MLAPANGNPSKGKLSDSAVPRSSLPSLIIPSVTYLRTDGMARMMSKVEPIDAPIQDLLEHENPCFGCGPQNPEGLQIKSFPDPEGDGLLAEFTSSPHHAGSGGVLGGGVQATLVDCHGVWTAVYHAAIQGTDPVPHYVTAELHMDYKRPVPLQAPVRLVSSVGQVDPPRAYIDIALENEEQEVCTEGRVVCHALDEGWGENPYLATED